MSERPAAAELLRRPGGALQEDVAEMRPNCGAVLVAPWALLRPGWAGRTLAAARRRDFTLALLLVLCVLNGTVLLFAIVDETSVMHRVPPANWSSTAPSSAPWTPEWRVRSFAQVWRDWHSTPGWLGPAELIVAGVTALALIVHVFLAWLWLMAIHRTGPAWPAYKRAVRIAPVALPWGVLVLATVYALVLYDERYAYELPSERTPTLILAALVGGWWGLVATLSRAAAAVSGGPGPQLPPVCEGCGYDLTHVPAEGRCSECARPATTSLAPDIRPGSAWANHPGVRTLVATAWSTLWQPARAYRRLRLRTPGMAERGCAMWVYLALSGAAAVWGVSLMVEEAWRWPGWFQWWTVALAAGLGCFVVGLASLVHRTVAAVAYSVLVLWRPLPDGRWAAKVLDYEAAFTWVVALYWGVLSFLFAVCGDWVREITNSPAFRSVYRYLLQALPGTGEPEVDVVLYGTGILALLWLWRYRIAFGAVRWSNR